MPLSFDAISSIRIRQKKGLPKDVHEKVKIHIADTIGISLAAYKGAPIALQAIKGISVGTRAGTGKVIGSNKQLSPAQAAFSNAALAHSLDYDDINDLARIHPTPVMLAAALAAANINENGGTSLIDSVSIGNELVCRLGYAIEPTGTGADSNWFLSQLFGYLGATVTAGLILELDDTELVNALGIAYMQAAGGKEPGIGVGSNARAIYPAFAAMGGVQAASLAREGVTAPASSLDGKTGLFNIYFGENLSDSQKELLLETNTWAFFDTSIKLYPSCRYSHPYISTALKLGKDVKYQDIKEITIGVNETANILCNPLEDRCRPQTLQDAKFSIPFMVAFALVHGEVNLNNLTDNSLKDFKVLELTKLIRIKQTQPNKPGLPLGEVQIKSTKGIYELKEPLTKKIPIEEIKNKFIQCCNFSNIDNPEKLWGSINNNMDYNILNRLPILDIEF